MSTIRVVLDFNCAPRLADALGALYGHTGFEFIHLQTLVEGRTEDEIWADAYKRFGGRVVLSGDARIAYKPHQAIAFIDNGFLSFFPEESWCQMPGPARAATLVHSWPSIARTIQDAPDGSCWRIPCTYSRKDGELRLRKSPLDPLRIPEAVLDRARQARAGRGV